MLQSQRDARPIRDPLVPHGRVEIAGSIAGLETITVAAAVRGPLIIGPSGTCDGMALPSGFRL
jgi:hypothetical protein